MIKNKRLSILLISLIIGMLVISSCGKKETEIKDSTDTVISNDSNISETADDKVSSASTNTLVVYFSATGNTKVLGEYIKEYLNCDVYEIVPETPYTANDLNYNDSSSRSSVEMNDASCRPAIAESLPDISNYDKIIIGHPIWWGQAPRIIYTFMENYDWANKTIVTFCTSASSGLGNSAKNLMPSASGNPVWLESRRFSANASKDDVVNWLSEILEQ